MCGKRVLFIILVSELYIPSLAPALPVYKCAYENTVNVTNLPTLENGFYIYDNQTLIADYLVGDYNYEVLYNGSNRNMLEFYQDVLNDVNADGNFMKLFLTNVTLANRTEVTKNLVQDFAHIVLSEFCNYSYPLSPEKDENYGWTLLEDGTLLRSDNIPLGRNEYCFELYVDVIKNETYSLMNPFVCGLPRENLSVVQLANYWTQVLSVPFFILTLIAYFSLPELRDVHGKCFMTYLSCLTTSYSIFGFINISQEIFEPMPCLVMGYLAHYMQLSQYTWLGIICLDIWRSVSDYEYTASYQTYALYGYHIPLLMTFLTFLAQYSVKDNWKPGISTARCGLEVDRWAALIYLYGPCSIILIGCLIFFILTSRIIKSNDQQVLKTNVLNHEGSRVRYALYLRLFLMMGLSWFLDVISYFLNVFGKNNMAVLVNYINSLQGLYVFVNFIGRARVRNIISNRLSEHKHSKPVIEEVGQN